MARYKTQEEIEASKKLQTERYPEATPSDIDPTQAGRDAFKGLIRRAPVVQSIMGPPPTSETFEMSPEIKRYGYNLFGMDQAIPSDVQIPFPVGQEPKEEMPLLDSEQQEPSLEQQVSPARQPASLQKPISEPKQISSQAPVEAPAQSLAAPVQQKQSDIDAMIKQKQEEEDRAALWKQSAKLRDAAMGAGSGTILKTDTSLYEDLEKKAQRPMQNLLLKQELEEKKAKNDPTSNISKLTRKSLEDLGMDMQGLEGVPYSQLEKLYPSLTQALYTKIAADAKKEEAYTNRLNKEENAANRKQAVAFAQYSKVAGGIDRLKSNMEKSETYKSYSNANDALIALDEALTSKDPNAKIQSSTAFMKFAKSAQGDSSVVRSEDMKVLAGDLNLSPKQLLDKFAAKVEGGKFSPGELETMKKVVQTIIKVKKNQLNKDYLQPIQKRAQANEYDLSESISPDFIRDIQGEQDSSTQAESSYSPKQEAGIKAYMDAKGLSRESAIQKLKEAKRL